MQVDVLHVLFDGFAHFVPHSSSGTKQTNILLARTGNAISCSLASADMFRVVLGSTPMFP
jgi:hypothetical protein